MSSCWWLPREVWERSFICNVLIESDNGCKSISLFYCSETHWYDKLIESEETVALMAKFVNIFMLTEVPRGLFIALGKNLESHTHVAWENSFLLQYVNRLQTGLVCQRLPCLLVCGYDDNGSFTCVLPSAVSPWVSLLFWEANGERCFLKNCHVSKIALENLLCLLFPWLHHLYLHVCCCSVRKFTPMSPTLSQKCVWQGFRDSTARRLLVYFFYRMGWEYTQGARTSKL